jgi:acyl dehydratase
LDQKGNSDDVVTHDDAGVPRTILPGLLVDQVELPVERGKIREFTRSTATTDPVHTDSQAAIAAGFAGIPATATYCVATGHYRDQAAFVEKLGMAIARVVVGSVSWRYLRVIVEGDVLTATRRVESDDRRVGRSGPMRMVTLATEFTVRSGEVVLVQREVLIERGVQ